MSRPTREQVDEALQHHDEKSFSYPLRDRTALAAEVRALRERNEQLESDMQCRNELSARIRSLDADNARLRAELEQAQLGFRNLSHQCADYPARVQRLEATIARVEALCAEYDKWHEESWYADTVARHIRGALSGDAAPEDIHKD